MYAAESMRSLGLALLSLLLGACPASIDLDEGHAYPCTWSEARLDDPSCPSGWVCGRDARCHVADAGPWSCHRDAGVGPDNPDCFGWACGVEGSCVEPVGAPYLCESDLDCFDTWRCDIGGGCIDSQGDELAASNPPDPSLLRLRNPTLFSASTTHVAVTPRAELSEENGKSYAFEGIAAVSDGGVLSLSVIGRGQDDELNVPFGGRFEGRAAGPVAEIVTRAGSLYALGTNGGLTEYRAAPDGGLRSGTSLPGVRGDRIRISSAPVALISVMGGSDAGYALVASRPDGALERLGIPGAAGALSPPPSDVGELVGQVGEGTCVLAVNRDGIHAANRNAFGALVSWSGELGTEEWRTLLPWGQLPSSPELQLAGDYTLTTHEDSLAAFLFQPDDPAKKPRLMMFEAISRGAGTACPDPLQLRRVLGACDPCPNFRLVKSVRPARMGGVAGAEVRCARISPFAEQTLWVTAGEQERCSATPLRDSFGPLADPLHYRVDNANGRATILGSLLQMWIGPNAAQALPLIQDRQTSIIVRTGNPQTGADLLLSDGYLATDALSKGMGALTSPFLGGVLAPVSTVRQAPSLFLLANGSVVDAERAFEGIASIDPALLRGMPSQAERIDTGSQQHLIVAAADTLYATTPEQMGVLEPRLSPFPASPIASMSFHPASDPTLQLEGYVVASGRVFHIGVVSEVVWNATEVPLGAEEALEVWISSEGRGRVGTSRGQIYSLPARVPLSPPLPGGQSVLDYEVVCDTVFAATAKELFAWAPREVGAAPEWTSVTGAFLEDALGEPRLHAVEDTLYLTTARGVVVSLLACPP